MDLKYHTKLEIDMCHRMMAHFDSLGVTFEWQLEVLTGIIDFHLPATNQIIECKDNNEIHKMMSALGQLLFYHVSIPGSHLFVASEPMPDPKAMSVFKKHGVKEWPMGWDVVTKYEGVLGW